MRVATWPGTLRSTRRPKTVIDVSPRAAPLFIMKNSAEAPWPRAFGPPGMIQAPGQSRSFLHAGASAEGVTTVLTSVGSRRK